MLILILDELHIEVEVAYVEEVHRGCEKDVEDSGRNADECEGVEELHGDANSAKVEEDMEVDIHREVQQRTVEHVVIRWMILLCSEVVLLQQLAYCRHAASQDDMKDSMGIRDEACAKTLEGMTEHLDGYLVSVVSLQCRLSLLVSTQLLDHCLVDSMALRLDHPKHRGGPANAFFLSTWCLFHLHHDHQSLAAEETEVRFLRSFGIPWNHPFLQMDPTSILMDEESSKLAVIIH